MKNFKYFAILFALLMVLFSSCQTSSPQNDKLASGFSNQISVLPNDTTRGYSEDIFENVDYIPLETTSASLLSKIDKLLTTEKYFAVLDKSSNAIFLFGKNGSFKRKFVLPENGKYKVKINDFDISGDTVFVYDINSEANKVAMFSTEGNSLGTLTAPHPFIYFTRASGKMFYNLFYRFDTNDPQGSQFSLISTNNKGSIEQKYFPYNNKETSPADILLPEQTFFKSKNTTYFSRPGNPVFYKLGNHGMEDSTLINLPKNLRLPVDYLTNPSYRKEGPYYITQNNRNMIWNINDIYVLKDRYLTFTLKSINKPYNVIFFDLTTKKYKSVPNMYYGINTSYLPLFERNIRACDGEFLYGSLNADLLFKLMIQVPAKKIAASNKVLKDFFGHGNTHSNPVITKFNIKSIN
jgi:hypothetical protein